MRRACATHEQKHVVYAMILYRCVTINYNYLSALALCQYGYPRVPEVVVVAYVTPWISNVWCNHSKCTDPFRCMHRSIDL